jgi:hypothetical protein
LLKDLGKRLEKGVVLILEELVGGIVEFKDDFGPEGKVLGQELLQEVNGVVCVLFV